MTRTKIMGIVGSLRSGSVNRALARAAAASVADDVDFEFVDLADVPLYNGDIEEAGLPAAVQALHDAAAAADGIMIFSPEYNGSFPAVTKNAIDWLTRPPKSWEGKAVSMMVLTPGPRGGASFRGHFDAIIGFQPVRLYPSLGIGDYGSKLTEGELTDPDALTAVADHMAGFVAFCGEGEAE